MSQTKSTIFFNSAKKQPIYRVGDLVQHNSSKDVGVVTAVRIRGAAGSTATYVDWVEVTYENGSIIKRDPCCFTAVNKGFIGN